MAEKNVGKTHFGKKEIAFLASAIKEGRTSPRKRRKRRHQTQLAFKTSEEGF